MSKKNIKINIKASDLKKKLQIKDGKDYVLTEKDKKDIAKSIEVPKAEVIREIPIITNEIKEVAIPDKALAQKVAILEKDIEKLEILREELVKAKKKGEHHIVSTSNRGLYQLLDVDVSGITAGQSIVWDGIKWIPYTEVSTDEKVKYNVSDTSAGYLADKTVAGTGITLAEGTGGDADKLKITNSAPDQTVAFTGGTNVTIGGTYPNFSITDNSQASDADLTAIAALGFTATAFLKKTALNTWALDTSTYQPLDATLTSLASVAGVQGDLLYASGTDAWARLAKSTTANQFLKNSGTSNNPAWATITTSDITPPASNTQVLFNDNGAWGGDADLTWDKTNNRLTTGGLYIKSMPDYYVPTAFTYAGTAGFISGQDYFMCRNGQVSIHEGSTHSTWGYTVPRLRLDVVGANETFSELSLSGCAIFEYNTGDRNRVFLLNKQPLITSGTGSSSSVLHWSGVTLNNGDPYFTPALRSEWEMGNDYWQGTNPEDFVTNKWWETGNHNFYLWDSVNGYNKLLITNSLLEMSTYDSVLAGTKRMFATKNYEGGTNSLFWGRNAGNYFGDTGYGGSICIGIDAGYNKTSSGSSVLVGNYSGGSQTNGSSLTCFGAGSGGGIDGDYNTCLGHFCASAGGAYTYSTQSLYVGNYINAGFGIYRVIVDTSGGTHNTYLKSSRHSLIFGTCSPSTPRTNSLYLNANVAVTGLNSVTDRDYGSAIFCRYTGEQLFKAVV